MARQIKRKRRTAAEVQEIKDVAFEELATANPMTLRQVHYRIVARADTSYMNTQTDYNQLSKWLSPGEARRHHTVGVDRGSSTQTPDGEHVRGP